MKLDEFFDAYPHVPLLEEVGVLTHDERESFIDLSHYMHLSPYSVNNNALLLRCFRMFRSLGLRHLTVVNYKHKVVGMITRKDLANAEQIIRANRRKKRGSAAHRPLPASPARATGAIIEESVNDEEVLLDGGDTDELDDDSLGELEL